MTAALDGDGKPMFEVLNTVTFQRLETERRLHWSRR